MQRQFQLRPSRQLAILLLAAHAAAIAALLPLSLPAWTKPAFALLLLVSLAHHLRHSARLSAHSSCLALQLENDRIVLTGRDGKKEDASLMRDSVVTPWLTVLNVLPQGARFSRSVVILQDSLDEESYRQLRVLLKWGGPV